MIGKLKEHDIIDPKTNSVIGTMSCDSQEIMDKLNEVIDAVNELQKKDTNKEPLDRYIKQRKWVGKLCKFEGENYGILKEIGCSDTKHVWRDGAFRSSDGYWYDFCEPVLPTDNAIYKGGDNE